MVLIPRLHMFILSWRVRSELSNLCVLVVTSSCVSNPHGHMRASLILSVLPLLLCLAASAEGAQPILFGLYSPGFAPNNYTDFTRWLQRDDHEALAVVVLNLKWAKESSVAVCFAEMRRIWENHSIPMLQWEPFDYENSLAPNDFIVDNNKTYQPYLNRFFDELEAFVYGPDRIQGTPDDRRIYISFAPVPNAGWYDWSSRMTDDCSVYTQTPQSFIRLWKYVIGDLRARIPSRKHVQVMWSVYGVDMVKPSKSSSCSPPKPPKLEEYFPGRALVDWVAVSGYNCGGLVDCDRTGWREVDYLFGGTIARVTALTNGLLPLAIADVGCTDVDHPGTKALQYKDDWLLSLFPFANSHAVRMIIYRNSNEDPKPNKKRMFPVFWNIDDKDAIEGTETYEASRVKGLYYAAFTSLHRELNQPGAIIFADSRNPQLVSDEAFGPEYSSPHVAWALWVGCRGLALLLVLAGIVVVYLRKRHGGSFLDRLLTPSADPQTWSSNIRNSPTAVEYKPLEVLSRSNYSVVYKVQHLQSHRIHVVKHIPIADNKQFKLAQNETDKAYRFQGIPGVIKLYHADLSWLGSRAVMASLSQSVEQPMSNSEGSTSHSSDGTDQGTVLVMKYFPQGSLVAVLKKRGCAAPLDLILSVVPKVALVLQRLHREAFVHCSVSPHHVLLDGEDVALTGFKLCTSIRRSAAPSTTLREAAALCDDTWAAPEMREGRYGPATDAWGLGGVLYAMISNDTAPQQPLHVWVAQCLSASPSEPYISPTLRDAPYPAALMQLLKDCLSLDPEQRPSMNTVLRELREFPDVKATSSGSGEADPSTKLIGTTSVIN